MRESTPNTPFDIKFIANRLKMRKESNASTVLLLGSRAGALFRSTQFYESLRGFSYRDFNKLSSIERFRECLTTLRDKDNDFSETDIHNILRLSLQDLAITRGDSCLAELAKHQHFVEIVSTNIDNSLEQSLLQVGMKEQKDFEIFYSDREIYGNRSLSCRITKVGGDFLARHYNLKRHLYRLDNDPEYKSALQRILSMDLLVIGLDPAWDEAIIRAIPARTRSIWFINEEDLRENPLFSSFVDRQHVRYLTGSDGSYEQFMTELHGQLYGGIPINYQLALDISQQLTEITRQIWNLQSVNEEILQRIKKIQEDLKKPPDGRSSIEISGGE